MSNNPFSDLLELDPRLAHFARQNQVSQSAFGQRAFAQLFPQLQNRFFGALGRQIQAGQAPSLRFEDFLNGLNLKDEMFRAFPGTAISPQSQPFTRFNFR